MIADRRAKVPSSEVGSVFGALAVRCSFGCLFVVLFVAFEFEPLARCCPFFLSAEVLCCFGFVGSFSVGRFETQKTPAARTTTRTREATGP